MTDMSNPNLANLIGNDKPGKRRKKTILISIISIVIVAAIVLGIVMVNYGGNTKPTMSDTSAAKESTVTRGDIIAGVSESGTATIKTVTIKPDVQGTLKQVFVKAGQKVSKGELIATLNKSNLSESIDEAQTQYDEAALMLTQTEIEQERNVDTARISMESAISTGETARLEYTLTMKKLRLAVTNAKKTLKQAKNGTQATQSTQSSQTSQTSQTNTSTQQSSTLSTDSAKLQLEEAKLNLITQGRQAKQTMNEALANAKSAQKTYENTVKLSKATIATKRKNAEKLKETLDDLKSAKANNKIYAPNAGTVNSIAEKGSSVNQMNPVATITNNKIAYVEVSVTQDDIASISIGKKASISFTAYSDELYNGKVDSITTTPASEGASTVSYTVSVLITQDASTLYEGMTGDVTFVSKKIENVLYVSTKAVNTEGTREYVKVKDSSGNISEVDVVSGFSNGTFVELKSGVNEGDTVIIESRGVIK